MYRCKYNLDIVTSFPTEEKALMDEVFGSTNVVEGVAGAFRNACTSGTVSLWPGEPAQMLHSAALQKTAAWCAVAAMGCGLILMATRRLRSEFAFKYTAALRDRDMAKLPKVYPDRAASGY
jgi:hypothetical protein